MRNQNFIQMFLVLGCCLVIGFSTSCVLAQKGQSKSTQPNAQSAPKVESTLIGKWTSNEAKIEFLDKSTMTINGDKFNYGVVGKIIIVEIEDGQMEFPFTLKGNTLTVLFEGRKVVYTRSSKDDSEDVQPQTPQNNRGSVPPELVGYWCYQADIRANDGGGRHARRCFILRGNGNYEYQGGSNNSNPNGGSSSESNDSGRWTATATTITAYSNSGETVTYSLEKRNHPKTGDAMLIVDGDAFVTQTQRPAW